MLNIKEISLRIEQPHTCKLEDVPSLKTLCESHPYSQIFPILYLKILATHNDIHLDVELQKYAYRIADRTVLFNLLNPTEEKISEVNTKTTIENKKENAKNVLTSAQQTTTPTLSPLPSLDDDVLQSLSNETKQYSINYELEENQKNSAKEHLSSLQQAERMSFIDWLDKNSTTNEQAQPFLHTNNTKKRSSSDLIERFINNESLISSRRNKIKKQSLEDIELTPQAIQSIDESGMPASETLAKIFIAQGNFSRAVAIYQQLCLLQPEKKSFFSQKIDELNKKII